MKILISACLLGVNCRYDGRSSPGNLPEIEEKDACFIPVCPEQLGGLPTPRAPSAIIGGNGFDVLDGKARVASQNNLDVTDKFLKGAFETLKLIKKLGIDTCYLKDRSPSCGMRLISEATGEIVGPGVTAALLIRENLHVIEIKAKAAPQRPD